MGKFYHLSQFFRTGFIASVVILSVTAGCRKKSEQFCPVVQQFQDSVKNELTLCFYPSTIRMLNLSHDSVIDNIAGKIQKVKIVNFNRSSDSTMNFNFGEWAAKVREQKFVDLISYKQKGTDITVFLLQENDKPKQFIGLISDSSRIVFADLVGNVPVKYIMEMATGKMNLSGFASVLNFKRPVPPKPDENHKKK